MFLTLASRGHEVVPVDASIGSVERAAAAAVSFSSDKMKWRSKFRYGARAAQLRTRAAERVLQDNPVDVVFQIGASFDPPGDAPYAIYSDWNMALDLEEAKQSEGISRSLTTEELKTIGKDHARRYRRAAMIFTISERLRQSFIDLYGINPERVLTAYAGPNFAIDRIERELEKPKPLGPPTVLFIAKEFHRKGGDLVATAFRQVLASIPEARLLFAGAAELPREFQGLPSVEHLGLLDKTVDAQLQRLLEAYRRADVMVLPSRHDPFPTVIREAMFFGIPCVTSNIWAMSEMIADKETGFLVASEDSSTLAHYTTLLLSDPTLRSRMGEAARRKAAAKFSWDAVGQVLHTGIKRAGPGE